MRNNAVRADVYDKVTNGDTMSEKIFNSVSEYEIKFDKNENILIIKITIERDFNKLYNDLKKQLKRKEEFWPRGNYHLPGINFTILNDNNTDYFKILYQRTKGLDYWYNPIDVYIELFLVNKNDTVEIRTHVSPTESAINKNILELKTYVLDIVVEIWKSLGIYLSTKIMNELYPTEDIEKRKQIRKYAKEKQIKLYLGFFVFFLVILIIIMLIKTV